MRISWIGIMSLLLAIAVSWHLISWCFSSRDGQQTASVWTFLGRVVFVLGALMVASMLLMGLSFIPRHVGLVKEQNHSHSPIAVSIQKQPSADVSVPIDKLWERLNRPQISNPLEPAEIVLGEIKISEHISAAATDQEVDEVKVSDKVETPKEKGGQVELVADSHQQTDTGLSVSEAPVLTDSSKPNETVHLDALVEVSEVASQERPDWVVNPPKRVGNTYRRVVVSGPFKTVDECHHELEEKLRLAVYQRMVAAGADDPVYQNFTRAAFKDLGIGTDYIYREICRDEYVESWEASFGPMVQVHLKLEFDPSTEQYLRNVWRQYQRRERLATTAILASSGLLLLGFVYGLLKLDTWTRGYYSKRLLFGVPAVIISLILLLGSVL